MTETRVLILDDEPEMLENLDRLLTGEGFRCWTLQDPKTFRDLRSEVDPDVLITDLKMPGVSGMTILSVARADDPSLPVIMITGHGSVSSAVEAMHEGAFDYLPKPFTSDQLLIAVERAARHRSLVRENRDLREAVRKGPGRGPEIIGMSPSFLRCLDQGRRVAPTDANVLIMGESGTGKEVVAGMIHNESRRSEQSFFPLDCAALPETLLESELFGHEKGAFTGAVARRDGLLVSASGGTLFLDEIGEMTLSLQAKLLRALDQRQVRPLGGSGLVDIDVRILAATNVDLGAGVRDGTFRQDLYYRLDVVRLDLPPLRERREDIALLAARFLEEFSSKSGREIPRVSPEVWTALEAFSWPGNIRQLRNAVHRLVALHDDGMITKADLPVEIRMNSTASTDPNGVPDGDYPLEYEAAKEISHRSFLRAYLHRLLTVHDGNVSRAAGTAGVSRRTLHRWLASLGNRNGGANALD